MTQQGGQLDRSKLLKKINNTDNGSSINWNKLNGISSSETNAVAGVKAIIDAQYVKGIINSDYIKSSIDATYIKGIANKQYIQGLGFALESSIPSIISKSYIKNLGFALESSIPSIDTNSFWKDGTANFRHDSNSLYSGNNFASANVFMCSSGSSSVLTIQGHSSSGWYFKAKNFGVTSDGQYSDNIFQGKVEADSTVKASEVITYSIKSKNYSGTQTPQSRGNVSVVSDLVPYGRLDECANLGTPTQKFHDQYLQYLHADSTVQPSDKRLKRGISGHYVDDDVLFDWLMPQSYVLNSDNKLHFGFIAQDVETQFMHAGIDSDGIVIKPHQDNEYYALSYNDFIAMNTAQIQKLKYRVSELEEQIRELKEEK